MRVVSPLHVAPPKLHSPEVSSTVSTPASVEKRHQRPFIVQGLHSAKVATCALSNSDTESECSSEVARINIFKDPNRCLLTTRLPPPQSNKEESGDDTECSSNTREEENGEQDSGDHDGHMLSGTFEEDAFMESVEIETRPASDPEERYQRQAEETQKPSPNRKRLAFVPREQGQKQAKETQNTAPSEKDPLTAPQGPVARKQDVSSSRKKHDSVQEQGQKQAEEKQKESTSRRGFVQREQYQKQVEGKHGASLIRKEPLAVQQEQSQKQVEEKHRAASSERKKVGKPGRKISKICMPRRQVKRVKVEVEADSDDSAVAVVPVVQRCALEKDSVSDAKPIASPRAGRKRNWHNKSLSSDEEDNHDPSSVDKVGGPKEDVETVVLPSLSQVPEKRSENPSSAKVWSVIQHNYVASMLVSEPHSLLWVHLRFKASICVYPLSRGILSKYCMNMYRVIQFNGALLTVCVCVCVCLLGRLSSTSRTGTSAFVSQS